MNRTPLAGIILAAGKGTRMKSDLPKCLHSVCGLPMAEHIGRALKQAGVEKPILVIGHGGDLMIKELGDSYGYAWQTDQLGTGHATLMAADLLANFVGNVIVSPGDTPLLSPEFLASLRDFHEREGAKCTVAVTTMADPTGYGRVVRDEHGQPCKIVEHKDADQTTREIKEINSAIYCFDSKLLFEILPGLSNDNAQGEYYLPDVLPEIRKRGGKIAAFDIPDPEELMGVNDRWQLAQAAKVMRERILRKHALNGVTLTDPDSIYIGMDVEIGVDTIVDPTTILEGNTKIGSKCHIGPNTRIEDSTVGDGCTVLMSHLNETTMLDGSRCGPFANLRPGSVIGEHAKIGNFVEVKNATLGTKVSVSHLSYIGDGEVGDHSNIGAGTIFCNYDGFEKHRTVVGADAFVGSNSTLIAPVSIGDGAMIAAGSVITKNVPDNAMAIGRGRQETKEEWAYHWRQKKTTGS